MNRVLVALTPLPEVFEEAEEKGADFLLFHHPLIFDPLKAVVTSSYPGGLLARAIRNSLAVYAAHTSYDAAPTGVSVALARTLGLSGPPRVLSPRGACGSSWSSFRRRTWTPWRRRSRRLVQV